MKPEATAIGDPQDGLWKITLMFDGRRFCIPKFRYCTLQTTRHWWFPTTSCFGITNHSEAALLWLVTQVRATINSGSPPSCGALLWQRSVASPSEMGWLASKVSRYISILCLWFVSSFDECGLVTQVLRSLCSLLVVSSDVQMWQCLSNFVVCPFLPASGCCHWLVTMFACYSVVVVVNALPLSSYPALRLFACCKI